MTVQARPFALDPDRLFPAEPAVRDVARKLYGSVKGLPIVSPHGHTDPRWYAEDAPFPDPARLFVVPDHYVHRMLCSQGIRPADLGVPRVDGGPIETDPRTIWRSFAENFHLLRGTPSWLWLNHTFTTSSASRPASPPKAPTPATTNRRVPRAAGIPSARPVRALQHRGDRHDRGRPRRPALAQNDPRLRLGRQGRDRLPSRRRRRPRLSGFAGNLDTLGAIAGRDTGHGQATSTRSPSAAPSSWRAARPPPTTATPPPAPPTSPHRTPPPSSTACAPARPPPRRRDLPGADAHRDGEDEPRRRARDADPPGRAARPQLGDVQPPSAATRASTSPSRPTSWAPSSRSSTRSATPRPHDHRSSRSTRPPTRASSPRSPGTIRRCGSGPPWWFFDSPRGDDALPRGE